MVDTLTPGEVRIDVPAACRDAWTWVAFYDDGDYLAEFDSRHGDQGWAQVRQGRVVRVELLPLGTPGGRHRAPQVLAVPAGAVAVFTRRRGLVAFGPDAGRMLPTVTILGWQRGTAGAFLYLADDGHALLADDFSLDLAPE